MISQYTCLGKVSYSRSSPIHKLTESQIEEALLAMQAGRRDPPAGSSSSSSSRIGAENPDATDIYTSSHYQALDFEDAGGGEGEGEGEFGEGDDSFLHGSPDSLLRLSHAAKYTRLSANEEWGTNLFRWVV